MITGVKDRRVTTRTAYTMERFYEAIEGKTFTAGEPSLAKSGPSWVVTFPPLDRLNQVQIRPLGTDRETREFQVRRGEAAEARNRRNLMASIVAGAGLRGWLQIIGPNARRCEELADITALELRTINL